jgi:hypothetical protein
MVMKKSDESELRLVLPVTCNDEYCDQRPRVAQLAVTPAVVRHLLADIRHVRQMKIKYWRDLCNVEVFDYSVDWGEQIDEHQPTIVHDMLGNTVFKPTDDLEGPILVCRPLPMIVGEDSCRTDCDRRSIYDDRIHWAAYLKHSDIEIVTESIRLEDLEKIARILQRPARRGGSK